MANKQFYDIVNLPVKDFLLVLEVMEETLAESLRKVCGYYGDEKKCHLKESSDILFSMGRLYMKKAEISKGMEQKLNFIKTAALLHGAKVRFERKFAKNTSKKFKVIKVLEDMEKLIMVASGGEIHCRSLLETSECIAMKFQHFRDTEREAIKMLEIIDGSVPEGEAKKRRLHKISLVRKLLKQNSENYKELMNEIAGEILQIFDFPPCEFAIAGLGSLAREEITLYSDFEHVIILEEGVQKRKYFENVREYFRWFSVLFHIIVIGVGETVLPSVGIQSLNDFYSGDKTKNWFFDSYTPVGVSFDGMMPHACKTPLGQQHTTERKSHIVELIQPVSKMLKYLTSKEDLKNGYCLKDILYQSCFLFGSEAVYESFKAGAQRVISLNSDHDSMESLSKKVKENVNGSVRGDSSVFVNNLEAIDSKSSFYRPLSTLLCYLARLYRIKGTSGFNKIQECREQSEHRISLMWAFAVACEIRLKLYAMKSGNRKRVVSKEILNFVGKPCLINCISAITDLSRFFQKPMFHSEHIFRRWPDSKAQAQLFLDDYNNIRDSIEQGKKETENPHFLGMIDPGQYTPFLAITYFREAQLTHDEEKKADLLKKAEETILSDEYSFIYPQNLHVLAGVYGVQGKHKKSLDVAEHIFSHNAVPNMVTGDQILHFRETQVDAAWLLMEYTDAVEYYQRFLAGELDFPSKLMFRHALARSQFELGEKEAGRETQQCVLEELKTGGRGSRISKLGIVRFIHEFFRIQFNEGLFEDCYKTLILAEEIIASGPGQLNIAMAAPQFVSIMAAITYLFEANRIREPNSEKYELLEKAAKICSRPENLEICQKQYCCVLKEMLECIDFKHLPAHRFWEILARTPKSVHGNIAVKSLVILKFLEMLNNCLKHYPREEGLLESLTGATTVVEFMQELHPVLVHSLSVLEHIATIKLVFHFSPSILWKYMDGQKFKYENAQDVWLELAGCMTDIRWVRRFVSKLHVFWRLLIAGKKIKQQILKLLEYTYGWQCWRWLLTLRAAMDTFCDVNRLPSCILTSEYHSALQCYTQADYNSSAQIFWRIAVSGKMGSIMQNRSIEYLNWAIICSLRIQFGYGLVLDKNIISVSDGQPIELSPEFVQSLESESQEFWKGLQDERLNLYSPGIF